MTLLTGPTARVVVGVLLGCLLGVLGLPRLNLPGPSFSIPLQGAPGTVAGVVQDVSEPVAESPPRSEVAEPTPTVAPANWPRVLIDERFGAALAQWPNDPQDTAWFAGGAFHLTGRQPNRFVAVGVPLPDTVGDAVLSAQFRKVGGPPGGGYGLIIRDQSLASERDGHSQAGQYLVVEVGDRGDIGVWRRDEAHWIDLVPWTHSDVVHPNMAMNALIVTTRGTALRVEVNGRVVAELTYDGLPPTGGVGIFVGGDLNQVALEWLRIEA